MSNAKRPADGAIDLGHLTTDISFVSRVLRARLLERNTGLFAAHNVAPGQVALLNLIALNPGVSQKQLSDVVVLKKSALTKAINEMESDGLIERRKTDGDKRYNALYLSEKGQSLAEALRRDMVASQEHHLAPLSAAERAQFFDMIWRLIKATP
ncbi:MAG: MarR family winged helix-turn-helix transcriptional regulator [Maritimibacter sp.]